MDSFETRDLYDRQDLTRPLNTLFQLSALSRKYGFQGPFIGVKYHTSNPRNFGPEILRGRSALRHKPKIYEFGMIEDTMIVMQTGEHARQAPRQVTKMAKTIKEKRQLTVDMTDIANQIMDEEAKKMEQRKSGLPTIDEMKVAVAGVDDNDESKQFLTPPTKPVAPKQDITSQVEDTPVEEKKAEEKEEEAQPSAAVQKKEEAEAEEETETGTELNIGDYELGQTIGTGSFGRVRMALHKKSGKYYVVKMLKKKMLIRLKLQNSQMWEYKILSTVKHPLVVNFRGMCQTDRFIYLALEFVHGGELWSLFKKLKELFITHAPFYAAQMVCVLSFLHGKGIVYRDWKAENILMDRNGYIKLIDFQFAKTLAPTEKTFTMCGTPEYIAPEILKNEGHSFSVDMWSLGILLYEMLTGDVPFWDEDYLQIYYQILTMDVLWPSDYNQEDYDDEDDSSIEEIIVDPVAKNMIGCLLVKDPEKRHTAEMIKKHEFFKDINWDDIYDRKIKPPWIPNLEGGDGDTQHFEVERYKKEDLNDDEDEALVVKKEMDPFWTLFDECKEIPIDPRKEIRKKMRKKITKFFIEDGIIHNGIMTFRQFIRLLNEINLGQKYRQHLREIFYWVYHEKPPKDKTFDVNGVLCKFVDLLCIDPNYKDILQWMQMDDIDFDMAIANRIEDNLDSIVSCLKGEFDYEEESE